MDGVEVYDIAIMYVNIDNVVHKTVCKWEIGEFDSLAIQSIVYFQPNGSPAVFLTFEVSS